MIKQPPILVTSIPRSGSSMITATINICGAFGGYMKEGDQSTKRGMYENVKIRESMVKTYLAFHGVDIMGQYPLLDTKQMFVPGNWKKRVEEIMVSEGYTEGPWVYKDARSALLWPIWNQVYPDAKWVIVRRRTGDILESCIKTGFMTAFKNERNREQINVSTEKDGWLWWVHEYEKRFVEMITAGVAYREIWPERMVNGEYKQLFALCDWLELKWNNDALDFIDTLLWGKQKERRK